MTSAWCDASALIRGSTVAGPSHVLTCVARSGKRTQHQCRHSQCSTAPERALEQLVPCASEPETAKPAQFNSKPYCRYSLHPEKRGQRLATVKAAYQVQFCAAASKDRPRYPIRPKQVVKTSKLAVVERNLSQILGEMLPKGDEYPKCPPGLCLVRVLEDQHHPYWVR